MNEFPSILLFNYTGELQAFPFSFLLYAQLIIFSAASNNIFNNYK